MSGNVKLGVSLGLKIGIGLPAVIWIIGELAYAFRSSVRTLAGRQDEAGDYYDIVKIGGKGHLFTSVAALIAVCALGIIGIILLYRPWSIPRWSPSLLI